MLSRIKKHPVLKEYIEDTCCENEVCVTVDDAVEKENVLILKVDTYYNSIGLGLNTPASIDCFIIRKCLNGGYGLTLVELKNIYNSQGFDLENMKRKFITTIDDFMKSRFRELLDLDYKDIKLYFVTNIDIYRRDIGLKLDIL